MIYALGWRATAGEKMLRIPRAGGLAGRGRRLKMPICLGRPGMSGPARHAWPGPPRPGAGTPGGNDTTVAAVIDLFGQLGLSPTAEGIGTPESRHVELLRGTAGICSGSHVLSAKCPDFGIGPRLSRVAPDGGSRGFEKLLLHPGLPYPGPSARSAFGPRRSMTE